MNDDLYQEEEKYTVTIFVEGGINIPFNMTQTEVQRVLRYLRRWPIFRPRTLELSTNDNQTIISVAYSRIVSFEANEEAYMKRLNEQRRASMEEALKSRNLPTNGPGGPQ